MGAARSLITAPDSRIDAAIAELAASTAGSGWSAALCGLNESEGQALSAYHRPSGVAALVGRGLRQLAAQHHHGAPQDDDAQESRTNALDSEGAALEHPLSSVGAVR